VWQKPVRVTIEGVTDLGDRGYYAYISPDGRRLMLSFARDRQEPENGDIYYCPALGTDLLRWGAPVNLGSAINTPAFDGAPFIAADNRTMYFASNGRSGYGDADLYVTHRIGEGWLQWTEPVDLGPVVNTPLSEASLSISAQGDYAYVSGAGNIGEVFYGAADIYRIKLPDTMRPQRTMTIEGKLVAGSTGIQGLIRAERLPDRKEVASVASDPEGHFTMILPAGEEYRLTGGSEGYTEASKNVDIRRPKSFQMAITLKLAGPARVRPVPVQPRRPADTASSMFALPPSEPVHFPFGSARLDEDAKQVLSRALVGFKAAVAAGRSIDINVTGHADDVGSAQANRAISLARANSVKRWLIAQGIDPRSITVRGRGKSQPIAPNDTREGRAQNRRVDIQIDGVLTVPNAVVTPKK
jgi:outer membrane protein OmpA-like peptidoglycan-associated protein